MRSPNRDRAFGIRSSLAARAWRPGALPCGFALAVAVLFPLVPLPAYASSWLKHIAHRVSHIDHIVQHVGQAVAKAERNVVKVVPTIAISAGRTATATGRRKKKESAAQDDTVRASVVSALQNSFSEWKELTRTGTLATQTRIQYYREGRLALGADSNLFEWHHVSCFVSFGSPEVDKETVTITLQYGVTAGIRDSEEAMEDYTDKPEVVSFYQGLADDLRARVRTLGYKEPIE